VKQSGEDKSRLGEMWYADMEHRSYVC